MTKKLCLLILLFAALAAGQGFDIKRLDWLAASATNTVDVTLEGPLLQLAAKFLSSNDPDEAKIKKLVGGLKGIYVRSFEFDKEGVYSDSDVATLRNQLRTPDWSRLLDVRSKHDGEKIELFLRTNHESGGLAIIVANPKQLTVVQILGKLDLDQLSELGGSLGVPKLDLDQVTIEKLLPLTNLKTSKAPAKKEHEE